jgi:hypothetical protein
MNRISRFSFLLALLSLAACSSPPPPAYTVVSFRLSRQADSGDLSKTFVLDSDLHGNGWTMRKGARIAFNADGTAVLDTVVYARDGLNLPNAIQLESVQYGSDGNIQFAVPGSDVGHSLHMRHPGRDYPYTVRFGFNPAYHAGIHSVTFKCRLLCEPSPPVMAPGGK